MCTSLWLALGTTLCDDVGMEHDTTNLARLGKRRERLVAQLGEVNKELLPEVMAAKEAGIAEERIAGLAGATRNTVQNWIKRERERCRKENEAKRVV